MLATDRQAYPELGFKEERERLGGVQRWGSPQQRSPWLSCQAREPGWLRFWCCYLMIISRFDLNLESTLLQAHSVPSLKSVATSASSPAFNFGWILFIKAACLGQQASQYNNFPLLYLFCLLVGFFEPGMFPMVGANPETLALEASEQSTSKVCHSFSTKFNQIFYQVESNFY